MQTSPPKAGRLAGLGLILAVLGVGYFFLRSFFAADVEIQAGIIAALAAVFATLWTQRDIKKREREARLHDKKMDAYKGLLDVLFSVLDQQRTTKGVNQARLVNAMRECKRRILMWASLEFIQEWTQLEEQSEAPVSDREKVLALDSILRLIRKDLGHDDSACGPGELIGFLLTSDARNEVMRAE